MVKKVSNQKDVKKNEIVKVVENLSDDEDDFPEIIQDNDDESEECDPVDSEDENEFEDQGSSDDEEDLDEKDDDDSDDEEIGDPATDLIEVESQVRSWKDGKDRSNAISEARQSGVLGAQQYLHTDDLSSDDEDADGNTIGRVPLHWYDAYDHIGYDVAGAKVLKRNGKDRLDIAISNSEDDPLSRMSVYDMYNDREVVLTQRDIEIIRRVQAGAYAHPEFNDTPDYVDYFSSIKEVMPLSAMPEPKRRFLPSKWEWMRVMKIVKAIKEGRYVSIQDKIDAKKQKDDMSIYMIWKEDTEEIIAENKKDHYHLPAPKMPLPGHAESYNPPVEYLLTAEEQAKLDELDPKDRPYNFIPTKFSCLRHVKGYENLIKERFERCLDLYLCPRKLKRRLNIDPETLVPRLPKPSELRPYPNTICLQYLGHEGKIRAISISPDGQYLASCSEDKTIRLWEVDTCLCRAIWKFDEIVTDLTWNPNPSHHILAAIVGTQVVLIHTGTGDADEGEITETLLSAVTDAALKGNTTSSSSTNDEDGDNDDDDKDDDDDDEEPETESTSRDKKNTSKLTWMPYVSNSNTQEESSSSLKKNSTLLQPENMWHGSVVGPRVVLQLTGEVTHVKWHHKGDYMCTVVPTAGAETVAIHQISKAKSQFPFKKSPGKVQTVSFHPSRPFLFVATQQHVKVYHLIEQKLVKKLLSGCKWISCMDIHGSGDHVVIGSFDRRVIWFDLDLSSTPYKTLKFHEKALRDIQFHKRYPLLASASDDGTVHVFHSAVYSDLTKNPMIVPLKVLRGHGVKGGLGVLSIAFHPKQPWIFTAGADGVVNLFQDI